MFPSLLDIIFFLTQERYSQFFSWQVQRYASLSVVTVLKIAEEPDGRVQNYHDGHTGVEHAGATDEVLWRFHVVFQRHYLQ